MKHDISTANSLTRGQESAVFLKIAEQTGIQDVADAVGAYLRGSFELVRVKILDMIGTITTSTTTEPFIAKEKFVRGSKEIKFYGFGDNFTKWFLDGAGKVEGPQDGRELRYGDLTKPSTDGPIIEEIGGEAKAETTLSELYDLLQKQSRGEGGVLLTNGHSNIFYVPDTSVVLRAVDVDWGGGGWYVVADPVGDPDGWVAGSRVFSGNS